MTGLFNDSFVLYALAAGIALALVVFATWRPLRLVVGAYLFALVAGDLVARNDSFTTMNGREVELNVWVRDGDLDRTDDPRRRSGRRRNERPRAPAEAAQVRRRQGG